MIRTLLFALFALSLQAHAAVVSFNPSSITVTEGTTFEIAVEGTGFDMALDGGGLNLEIEDPAVLQILDVVIDGDTWDLEISDVGDIDDAAGTVDGTSFAHAPPVTGDFPILVYQFVASRVGTTSLMLTEFDGSPFTSGLDEVALSFPVIGTVHVIPEPAAAWMLAAGLGLLALLRIRRT
jgi:hypothetical protein